MYGLGREEKRFASMVILFFAAFFLGLFMLIEFRPRFLEPLKKAIWSFPAVSFFFALSALSLGTGIVLLMPSRTGEYEEYSLGIALLFLGSISLSIALTVLLDLT